MMQIPSDMKIQITLAYGRKLEVSEAQCAEWLDDLPQEIDEVMAAPLSIGDDRHRSFSPFAFCAPEIIRSAVTHHILATNLQSR